MHPAGGGRPPTIAMAFLTSVPDRGGPLSPGAPDSGSPRTQAAMKVLGIMPRHLEPKSPESFANLALTARNQDLVEARANLFEKKRTALMQDIMSKADLVPGTLSKSKSWAGGEEDSLMASIQRHEAANLAMIRKNAKNSAQKQVVAEINQKEILAKSKERMEEATKRTMGLRSEREKEFKAIRVAKEKAQLKRIEAREKADRLLVGKCEELKQQIAEGDVRTHKMLEQRAEQWEETARRLQEERAEVFRKKCRNDHNDFQLRWYEHQKMLLLEKARDWNLDEAGHEQFRDAAEKAEKIGAHQTAADAIHEMKRMLERPRPAEIANKDDHISATQAKAFERKEVKRHRIEGEYHASTKKLFERQEAAGSRWRCDRCKLDNASSDSACPACGIGKRPNQKDQGVYLGGGLRLNKDELKELRVRKDQGAKKIASNLERLDRELKEGRLDPTTSPKLKRAMSDLVGEKEQRVSEWTQRLHEQRSMHADLVSWNQEINKNAYEHHEAAAMEKIGKTKKRIEHIKELRDDAAQRRISSMAKIMHEKHDLNFKLTKVRDAAPERMNEMLRGLGLPPIGQKTDGEEDEEHATKK